jgi:3-oxoacyl-[acyl-carrier-protein] synthase III
MVKTRFESLGCHMPERVVTSKELLRSMAARPRVDLARITGIERRRYRGVTDDSLALGLAAARDCLARSRYRADEVEAVIWTSITRLTNVEDFQFEPAMSLCLKNELGAAQALHFDLTNACAGMLTGVLVLDDLIKAGVVKNGLVVSGEVITHLTDTALREITDAADEQLASLTVGDSGAAVLMDRSPSPTESVDCADMRTYAQFSDLCFGMPSARSVGRARMAMYTKAVEIHAESVRRLPRHIGDWLTTHAATLLVDPVRPFTWVIPHQTALRVMTKVTREIFDHIRTIAGFERITMPELLTYIREFGNTSTTSHFVVLYHALKDKKVRPGDSVLLVPQASGIVAGFTFVRLGNLEV